MDRANIPEDISRFVLLAVPSVAYLEAMLLMRRENAQPWDANRLAERIYVDEKAARNLISALRPERGCCPRQELQAEKGLTQRSHHGCEITTR